MQDFSKELLYWFDENKRALPWRENITAYRVWISEIMLQQTRIETVKSYYLRFMETFPTVEALAEAPLDQVLKLWEGLGYYSRARNLHACAKKIVSDYNSVFPADLEQLRKLPGIGDYTAAAIASIAFGIPAPAVDGNVVRVLSRLECYNQVANDQAKSYFRQELKEIIPAQKAGDFTAALMELGETICLPGTPNCTLCPLQGYCLGYQSGTAEDYPIQPAKKARKIEKRNVFIYLCGSKIAFRQRPDKGLLAKLWELPNELAEDNFPAGEFCGEAVHVFSHIEWHMKGYIVRCEKENAKYCWFTKEELQALAVPSAFRYYMNIVHQLEL